MFSIVQKRSEFVQTEIGRVSIPRLILECYNEKKIIDSVMLLYHYRRYGRSFVTISNVLLVTIMNRVGRHV